MPGAVKPTAFAGLKALGDERLAEVDRRLLSGDSPQTVATWLQEDEGQCLNVKAESLKRTLDRYRASELKSRVVESVVAAAGGQHVATLAKRLDAAKELEELARIQKGRLAKILGKETVTPLLMEGVTREVKVMREVLTDLAKLQVETGILPRAAKTVNGTVTNPETGNVKTFSWTEEFDALQRELEAFPEDVE